MTRDLLDRLREADPLVEEPDPPAPDWDLMAARILASPRGRARAQRRVRLALAPVAAAVGAVLLAAVLLAPGGASPTVLERAYAAVSAEAIYHYRVTVEELEGPERRPVAGTRSSSEGWIDPSSGEIHELADSGDEWATDGERRTTYFAPGDSIQSYDEPAAAAGSGQTSSQVLTALTRSMRAGALVDAGPERLDGRAVRRFTATNPARSWRQTFWVDAETFLPVRFVTETGEHLRDGRPIGARDRVIEQRFELFERLPAGTDRSVLKLRPHPGARSVGSSRVDLQACKLEYSIVSPK